VLAHRDAGRGVVGDQQFPGVGLRQPGRRLTQLKVEGQLAAGAASARACGQTELPEQATAGAEPIARARGDQPLQLWDAFTGGRFASYAGYGDSEEQNLLFKGISNLITTRSDVFTVYFRIRTVKQDPTTGGWNGVDPDSVLEDARYVMCVDRSNVNRPTDQPRIVYFSRVSE
jgi:hypothetical protein